MKLFLSSLSVNEVTAPVLSELVGESLSECTFLLCENAADVYDEDHKDFVYETRKTLQSFGIKLDYLDLREYRTNLSGLRSVVESYDVLWFGGGNTYYLRWIMKDIGFDTIAKDMVDGGVVYGGGSAGAIVATSDLRFYDIVDDSNQSPEHLTIGLGLTDVALVPHWGTKSIEQELAEIRDQFIAIGKETICLTDSQAVVIVDGTKLVVG